MIKNNHHFMYFFSSIFSLYLKCICFWNKSNYSTSWKLSNAKASKNGATASASITAKQYHQNGSILKTIDKTVKLTYSPTGSLS